jgi:hypothetical protein
VVSDEKQVLQVRASYTSLADWTRLLERLNAVDLVRQVTIVELTKNYAYVDLAYIGSVPQLTNNLDQNELVLGGSLTARLVANAETASALGVAAYIEATPDVEAALDVEAAPEIETPQRSGTPSAEQLPAFTPSPTARETP